MRRHLITNKEREAIMTYLKDGKKVGMIRTLLYRARRYLPDLKEELSLLEKLAERGKVT